MIEVVQRETSFSDRCVDCCIYDSLTSSETPSLPAILSSLMKSYREYNTRHVTSLASTPSSRNGYDKNSV